MIFLLNSSHGEMVYKVRFIIVDLILFKSFHFKTMDKKDLKVKTNFFYINIIFILIRIIIIKNEKVCKNEFLSYSLNHNFAVNNMTSFITTITYACLKSHLRAQSP